MTPLPLTNNLIKETRSLEQRKFRKQLNAFLAEGNKLVGDLLSQAPHLHCWRLIATAGWLENNASLCDKAQECYVATPAQVERLSLLPSPQDVMAVFYLPSDPSSPLRDATLQDSLVLALDGVQDPGNLGTIIRTADWFGIRHIYCSQGTADCYAPKVVQASMGALARVQLHYVDLPTWLDQQPKGTPVYGTFLGGSNLYETPLAAPSILVMGNEGRGISDEVAQRVTRRVLIPSPVGDTSQHVESLNVSIATAICLSEFYRTSCVAAGSSARG